MPYIPNVADMYGGDPALTDGTPTIANPKGTPKPAKLAARHEQYQKQIKAAIHEGLVGDTVRVGSTQYNGQDVPLVKIQAYLSARAGTGPGRGRVAEGSPCDR